jgi:hypothetical protein
MRNKILAIGVLALFLVSLINVQAYSYYSYREYDDGDIVKVKETYKWEEGYDPENGERRSVYNYRHGFSYRSRERHEYYSGDPWRRDSRKHKRVRYVPYLDDYEEKGCYNYPPKNKLFYIKC